MKNSFSQTSRRLVITSILLVLVGLTYAGFSVYSIVTTRKFIASTPTTEAKVVNVSRKRYRKVGYKTQVYVTYTINEEEYAHVRVANAPSTTKKDEMIIIHYNPENPESITAANQSYTRRLMGTLIGSLMAVFGIKREIKAKKE